MDAKPTITVKDKILKWVNDEKITNQIIIELLSPDQRKIVDFLIATSEPVKCGVISKSLGIPSRNISTQIANINTKGDIIFHVGNEKQRSYYITDKLPK